MTIAISYATDISRVRLSFSGYSVNADYAKVERSTDGINWSTVRGGDKAPLTLGAGSLDDFEFVPNVANTYRVTAIDAAPQAWVGSGGPVTGNNATVTPACAGNTIVDDLVLLFATIRNSGTGVPNTPSGWTLIVDMGNARIFGRYATVAGSQSQAVTFTGGVANADTTAQMATLRNTNIAPNGGPSLLTNASAQNINWPTMTPSAAPSLMVAAGWKQDDWTSAPTTSSWDSELGQIAATAGDDAGHVWWVQARTTTAAKAAGFWTVTGGAAAISKSALVSFGPRPFTNQETASITPTFAREEYWLKSPSRPGLNAKITVTEVGDITRDGRTGIFPVLGRTNPVSVSDVSGSRKFDLEILVTGNAEARDMDNRLALGEPLFLQAPSVDDDVPTVYFVVGDVERSRLAKGSTAIVFRIPVTEVATPGSTVAGATYTYLDLRTNYATYAAVVAGNATYAALRDKVSNSVIIVT